MDNSDFRYLRESSVSEDEINNPTREQLDAVVDGQHLRVNEELYRVEGRSHIVETNKKFTKTKSYTESTINLRSITKTGDYVFLSYGVDDNLEIFLSGERMSLSDIGVEASGVGDITCIQSGGKQYFLDDNWRGIYTSPAGKKNAVSIYEFVSGETGLTIEGYCDMDSVDDFSYEAYSWREVRGKDLSIC